MKVVLCLLKYQLFKKASHDLNISIYSFLYRFIKSSCFASLKKWSCFFGYLIFERAFPAEECIKFVVVTYVATGFSDIEIETGTSETYKGFMVDSKIKMKASRFGAEGIFETIRSICAS